MIVQEADPADVSVAGEHASPDKDTPGEIVTDPPVVLSGTVHDCAALPSADNEAADELFVELFETVSVTVAMAPSPITF